MSDVAKAYAVLHARCFTAPRPWNAEEFGALLGDPLILHCGDATGFALGRVVVDEAELLTIAVAPEIRREGRGTQLLDAFLAQCRTRGAKSCFLEVAANNAAALSMYRSADFLEAGRRPKYYAQQNRDSVDAILLSKRLKSA